MRRRNWTKLDQPLRARKPATWVMPNVFGTGWTDERRDKWFAVVAFCVKHLFELSTENLAGAINYWTNPTLQLGVSPNLSLWSMIRDQYDADRIVPQLLGCPAAVRGVRAVLRGPVDLRAKCPPEFRPYLRDDRISRLRISGETGRAAAPCNVQWIRSMVQQGQAAGVPVFVKQLGSNPQGDPPASEYNPITKTTRVRVQQVLDIRDRKGGDPSEWPADLRVRQWPGGGA